MTPFTLDLVSSSYTILLYPEPSLFLIPYTKACFVTTISRSSDWLTRWSHIIAFKPDGIVFSLLRNAQRDEKGIDQSKSISVELP